MNVNDNLIWNQRLGLTLLMYLLSQICIGVGESKAQGEQRQTGLDILLYTIKYLLRKKIHCHCLISNHLVCSMALMWHHEM